jgi:hypothetical protein
LRFSSQLLISCFDGESAGWEELLENGLDGAIGLLGKLSLSSNSLKNVGVLGVDGLEIKFLEGSNIGSVDFVEVTSDTGVKDANLLLCWHWNVLLLLKELSKLLTSVKELLGGGIKIGTELGESGNLSVLGELELHGSRNLLHGLDLSGGSDSGYGKTDVNGWSDTFVEELCLQEDLSISDRNNVSWDICGHITSLGLNNWKSGQRTTTVVLVHLSGSLKKSGMEIEDISWIGLSAWWSSKKKRHLSVSDGLLGKIVIDDESVPSRVSEEFSNSASGIWSQELKWGGIRSSGSNDDSVVHGTEISKGLHDVSNCGSLLSNSDVDAEKLLLFVSSLVILLLVDNGINGNSGLTSLSISNDELSLSSTDWHEGVYGFESSLHGLVHGFSWDNTWGLELNSLSSVALDWAETIDSVTEWVNDSTEHTKTNWNIDDGSSSLDDITLLDFSIVT